MKYIMMFDQNSKRYFPIIFPSDFVHKHMAGACQGQLGGAIFLKAVSAGDYNPMTGVCSGESETLKLKSREEDTQIIQCYNYMHGIV